MSACARSRSSRSCRQQVARALAVLMVLGALACVPAPSLAAGPGSGAPAAVSIPPGPGTPGIGSDTVARFAWLAGCWSGTLAGGATYEEIWMPPLGGSLVGMARMSREGRTLSFEFMRIDDDGENAVFAAQPSGRAPTEFRAVETGSGSVVFANEGHDFPQRVTYRLATPDSLHAAIDGLIGEQRRTFHFPLARSRCPDPGT